jgi:DtxR family transcriptional regulator, Mn-dependent transcriptional regulator
VIDGIRYLFLLVIAIGLACLFLWVRWGLVRRWRKEQQARNRIHAEDALKHLYYCETEARRPTLPSIAGRLQIPENRAVELMQTMQAHGLVQLKGDQLELTPDGRAYALHIVRAHRLWERYLADETGYAETRWHAQADQIEHELTPNAMEDLAGRLGYPLIDPHGDPIPTKHGELAGSRGQPLTTLSPGQTGRITHLEDEPEAVYAQLVAEGFYPGMLVHVLDQSQQYVRVWADGDEHRVAPIVAATIAVEPVAQPVAVMVGESLADLRPPERARVREISPRCRGSERRRLLDLGLVPGTLVTAELVSPSGDPTAYRIRDTLMALRREQASFIQIERLPLDTAQAASNGEVSA